MSPLSDLERFYVLFDEGKSKVYKNKIEYRGISNLEAAVTQANKIINNLKLKLMVNNSGDLASYKAFEVIEIADQEAAAA